MATTALGGNPCETVGELPAVGSSAPPFTLIASDFSEVTLPTGSRSVLNIFPSIDTGVCAASVKEFNARAAGLENTSVICVSADLPFALARFCGAEGIKNVTAASAFRSDFGTTYGVTLADGAFQGLFARAVVVVGTDCTVLHTELVPEIGTAPDYDAAVAALG